MAARRAIALVVAALAAPCAGALELGTLFTTPEERARLDRLRRGEPESASVEHGASAVNHALTGFVKRSDGRHTVWIDGSPVPVSRPGAGDLLEPRAVGSPARQDNPIRFERKPPQ
ncbi:MAG: hypothetical protein ABI789_06565 [Usitatibacter sp.]